MSNYSEKQLSVHGELILAHIANKNLRWRYRKSPESKWQTLDQKHAPGFYVQYDWEIIEPMATLEDGSLVYEGDEIHWFDLIEGEVQTGFATMEFDIEETATQTRVFLDKKDAYRAGVKKLTEFFNSQFEEVEGLVEKPQNVPASVSCLYQMARDIESKHAIKVNIIIETHV